MEIFTAESSQCTAGCLTSLLHAPVNFKVGVGVVKWSDYMRDGARGSTALMTEEEIDEIQQADLCQPVPSSAPRGLCQWTAVTRSLSNWLFRAGLYTGQFGRVTSMLYALEW